MFKKFRQTLRGMLSTDFDNQNPNILNEPEIRNTSKGGIASVNTNMNTDKFDTPPIYIDADDDNEDQFKRGQEEAVKEAVKNEEMNKQKFETLVSNSERELFRMATKNPFELFPQQIIIDVNKISIVTKPFFLTEHIHSIYIQDIKDVNANISPLFAAMEIMDNNPQKTIISRLDKKEAIKARKIIQGLIVAKKQEIDLSKLNDNNDLTEKLEKLGASQEEDK